MKKLTKTDWHCMLEFAENDMNISRAAKSTHMSRQSVYYHLQKAKKLTGLDPLCFYDLVELLDMRLEGNDG